MLKFDRFIGFLICLEIVFISTMLHYDIGLQARNIKITLIDWPITFQITSLIILTSIFSDKLVIRAFLTYLLLGLFLLPIFFEGGSLGYMLTPNFGYLIGSFPLIKITNKINKKHKIGIIEIFKTCIHALMVMHIVGISYLSFLSILFNKLNLITYNIALFSLSKLPFQIISLIPTILVVIVFKKLQNKLK